ncbi:uncharacterized protein LOC131228882 [Magnolia sinica]|uniref:uncharacterized protein LOC131228882 n=1 Tax=Magnolia sinica TaxID=86752 RepID=UPI00265B679E|nr:uncharacterized protein LOC131228882 [Magnolia sinica]
MISSLGLLSTSKTDQILSRYRPIAPRPQLPPNPLLDGPPIEKNILSPFLKNLSSHHKTRSTRSRKRTKTCNSTAAQKRSKTHHLTQPSPHASCLAKKTQLPLSSQTFGHGLPCFPYPSPRFEEGPSGCGDLVTLPLLPYPCHAPALHVPPPANGSDLEGLNLFPKMEEWILDLNCKAEVPEEKDLLQNLQLPIPGPTGCTSVIVPQPVRPIGSSISVACISETTGSGSTAPVSKMPEEVEEEMESEALPSVVSDSNNKVRLANSAYKEMVGQPECPWLDSMVAKDGRVSATTSKTERISGEVMLDLSDSSVPISSNGFSCRVKIEWASNGQKMFINAPCDVIRLSCESKDYLFTWRFLIPNSKA